MKTQQEIAEMAKKEAKIYADNEAHSEERCHFKQGFIKGYQAAQEEMKWISVEDRLPECHEQHGRVYSSGKVLVYGNEGIEVAEYIDTPKSKFWHGCQGDITHWMPLPKKPLIP